MEEVNVDKKNRTSFFKEFREFAVKGNMLDMAVGIIIGTAFNKVVNTLVKQVIMPPLSALTDGVHISERKYVIRHASEGVEEIAIEYGALIEALIDFVIIALTVFIFIKFFNSLREKAYQTRIRTEIDKLKEILEGVKEPVVTDDVTLPKSEPVVEEKVVSDESQLLANIEKLLQKQNEILQNRK